MISPVETAVEVVIMDKEMMADVVTTEEAMAGEGVTLVEVTMEEEVVNVVNNND